MSLKYTLNKTGTNPVLYIYCTAFLFVMMLLVIIFEKPCLRKGNKGCMLYVCMSLTYRLPNKTGPKMDP